MEKQTVTISNFIDNSYSKTENLIESFNPSNGQLLCVMPDSGESEANLAVRAAKEAFEGWSQESIEVRAGFLNKIGNHYLSSILNDF